MNISSSTFKRMTGFILVVVLLLPLASGCASKNGQKTPGNVFALPTWKDQSKPKKPKKDPSTPLTMGEAMMQPRNDVL